MKLDGGGGGGGGKERKGHLQLDFQTFLYIYTPVYIHQYIYTSQLLTLNFWHLQTSKYQSIPIYFSKVTECLILQHLFRLRL